MEEKIYLITKESDVIYKIPNHRSLFSLYSWAVFSIPKVHYDFLVSNNVSFFEITREESKAFKTFGDDRPSISVSLNDDEEFDEIYNQYGGDLVESRPGKVKLEVTETRYNNTIKMMQLIAKILLEEEFDRRYKKFKYNNCELECTTWDDQLKEAENYRNGDSNLPLLSMLSESQNISINELVFKIEEAKKRNDSIKYELYEKLVLLKNEFKSCTSIIDLNLLYMKYFNINMTFSKEFKLSRPDLFNDKGGLKVPLGVGLNF